MSSSPEIFDRALRRLRRDRAARMPAEDFVRAHIAAELIERLELVKRAFTRALDLGSSDDSIAAPLAARGIEVTRADAGPVNAARGGGQPWDEDCMPLAEASFDLVVWAGGMDQVNDLPGALIQIRRVLRPDGLFIAGLVGAGSLPRLRAAMHAADMAGPGGAASPRLHPQIDVRAMGDLLQRAGFALPVADGESLDVRYRSLAGLVADIRAAGAANALIQRSRRALTRLQAGAAFAAFQDEAEPDGRVRERLELIYCLGWAPDESQPKPARRGSAVRSLADELKGRG
ncbi:class I SAM-dependent methyltransferase [Sphingomonas quercus]|nr:methyltransferase domain-containing protein [Sphingomonas quercus]